MILTLLVVVVTAATVGAAPLMDGPLTLDRALELAAQARPELAAAAAKAGAAAQRARQQGAWPNPTAFFVIEGAPVDGDAWQDGARVLGLEQTLPLGGRIGAGRDAGRHLASSAEAERELTSREVEASVRTAFAAALRARGAASLRDDVVAGSRRMVDVVELLRDTGGAADDEVAHARFELGMAELDAARAAADLDAALADLAAAVGAEGVAPFDVEGVLGAPGDVPDLDVLTGRLEASPALRAALARAAAGDAAAKAASRSRLPDLGVRLGMRRFGGGGDAFDAGVSLDVPLFDRGGARTAAARADAVADAARVRGVRLDLERRLRGLHARLAAADRAAQALSADLLPAADAVLAAAERRHEVGDADLVDLLQVRASWLERRLIALDVRFELDAARAELNALF